MANITCAVAFSNNEAAFLAWEVDQAPIPGCLGFHVVREYLGADDKVEATPMPQPPTDHAAAAQARHAAASGEVDAQHHASNGQTAAQQAVQGGLSAAQAAGPLDGHSQVQAVAGGEVAAAPRSAHRAMAGGVTCTPPNTARLSTWWTGTVVWAD